MALLVQDRSLREAFKRGEREALARVYDEYAKSVFSLLYGGFSFNAEGKRVQFCGYRESWQLENTVQEVFVRAFGERARLSYDGLRPYRNYLFAIARNLVVDARRTGNREILFVDAPPEDAENAFDDAPVRDPETEALDNQLHRDVAEFVGRLEGDERKLFQLRFREEMSIEAVAKTLDRTEHWAKSREKKIKGRFFRWMRERGHFEGYKGGERARFGVLLALLAGSVGGGR